MWCETLAKRRCHMYRYAAGYFDLIGLSRNVLCSMPMLLMCDVEGEKDGKYWRIVLMKKVIIAGLLLVLSGCSSQFMYNNLDWMIHWYLDDYIDLNKGQRKLFDEQFSIWHGWHRNEELAKYVAQLEQARGLIAEDKMTKADVDQQFNEARNHWIILRNRIAPDLIDIAVTLSDEQVADLFSAMSKENQKEQEKLDELYAKSEQKRIEKRQNDIEENLEEWMGRLTSEQKTIIKRYVGQFRPNWQNWLVYQRHIQSEARKLFDTRNANADFQSQLLQLMTNPESYRHKELNENSEFNSALFSDLTWEVLQTITPKQRAELLDTIDDYIDDFSDLRKG